jgi:hypothetical protein
MSTESSVAWKKSKHSKSFFRRARHDSIGSSVGSRLNHVGTSLAGGGGAGDMTSVSLTDDYFSDVNVKSVRRLMNVIYVMGRLMKAFNIDFRCPIFTSSPFRQKSSRTNVCPSLENNISAKTKGHIMYLHILTYVNYGKKSWI